ncbi:DUF4255 domain-containing protein [Clostridium sp. AM58-1XD]|uniref:DUF4255 domain-containing protein n=1 Tax=Clostridium sp. AM58-1XD TaxID=2292307 RepID=UPI0015F5EB4B|nr:DUF4255 domain-containing protein [Clostridium sp. AM58-1XD]
MEMKVPWWMKKKEGAQTPLPKLSPYMAVPAVSRALVSLLQDHMVPSILPGLEEVGICSPSERGDLSLMIWMYDVQESDRVSDYQMRMGEKELQFPPTYLDLYYMIAAYSKVDIQYRAEEEQKILMKVMEIFRDYCILDESTLRPAEKADPMAIHIEPLRVNIDDKLKMWGQAGESYRLSLFYRVSPVRLENETRRKITRVTEIDINPEFK